MKKENKGLQKFTDFESLKTVENFKEFKENNPEKFKESLIWLSEKLNTAIKENKEIDKYFNRIENVATLLNNENAKQLKRERWRVNESKIKNCIHTDLTGTGHIPSVAEISEKTGLSRVTVSKHLTETNLSLFKIEQQESFKILNSNVLQTIYRIGMQNGDIKALKMFFQLTGGNIQNEIVVNNNYIQVNNTKIDNAIINQLPNESREAIEKIIIDNTTVQK
jgi:hypothetical protein